MIKLIKNAEVYAPEYLGTKDVLIENNIIGHIADKIDVDFKGLNVEIIDASGKLLFPGFIDCHVHILGGGGEGSYKTRTPELVLSTMIKAGVTTVVGCRGTDGVTRSGEALVAKAKGLKEEGVSCYLYTGCYDLPVYTTTGSIKKDIMMIEEYIGVGEVAIADHRSSQPTYEEFIRAAADARVAGMLSGKAGVVNVHMGDAKDMLNFINMAVENSSVPITQFLPTHVARNVRLFSAAIEFAKKGGNVDLTTDPSFTGLRATKAVVQMLEAGVDIERITFSSDGQGSLPVFNEKGELVGLEVGLMGALYGEVRELILGEKLAIEKALKIITENPARTLKLTKKGKVAVGKDADLVLVDKDTLNVDTVIALGQIMMKDKTLIVKGTFEK